MEKKEYFNLDLFESNAFISDKNKGVIIALSFKNTNGESQKVYLNEKQFQIIRSMYRSQYRKKSEVEKELIVKKGDQ